MKNVLFITSHLFSGAELLADLLNYNSRVQITHTGSIYNHPSVLERLFAGGHKLRTNGAIYGDLLLYNSSLCNEVFYDFCKFIYVIRPAGPTINTMLERSVYTERSALMYYNFRLERICEMAKRTPTGLVVTWDALASRRAMPQIEDYLGLIEPIRQFVGFNDAHKDIAHYDTVQVGQDAYERHLYYLRHLPIKLVQ